MGTSSSPGTFRLGALVDAESHDRLDEPLLYESGDLTTHGVIVGMTGSGKTGLAIDLLEEALSDGIPTLVIDPKGDMGNLLLTFPQLRPEDFRPWIDERVAQQQGQTPDEFAAAQAQLWTDGLAGWNLGSPDITALREGAHFTIYTPGSDTGVPLDLIGSLAAWAMVSLLSEIDIDALVDTISGASWGWVLVALVLAQVARLGNA
ncbi:MAG: helicase HerA-like domain-containing protein, partial [Acidimicrobiales bacterium]